MFSIDVPLVFAYTAGFVAAFNPCGAAMLPAYIGYQLDSVRSSKGLISTTFFALLLGFTASLGFVVVFGFVSIAFFCFIIIWQGLKSPASDAAGQALLVASVIGLGLVLNALLRGNASQRVEMKEPEKETKSIEEKEPEEESEEE